MPFEHATTLDLADLQVARFEAGTSWIGLSPKDRPRRRRHAAP